MLMHQVTALFAEQSDEILPYLATILNLEGSTNDLIGSG